MDQLREFLQSLHDPQKLSHLVSLGGFPLLAAIVFSETGLLAGFFLPGDSLLFVSGFLIGLEILKAPSFLPQTWLAAFLFLQLVLMIAAFIGNTVGYWVGAKAGPPIFNRPNSRLFKREHLVRAHEFYEKNGGRTIIIAEFMPFLRTFAPVVAGAAGMTYRRFIMYNAIGVVAWVFGMSTLGALLARVGRRYATPEGIMGNLDKVVIGIVLLSVTPAIIHFIKDRRAKAAGAKASTADGVTQEP